MNKYIRVEILKAILAVILITFLPLSLTLLIPEIAYFPLVGWIIPYTFLPLVLLQDTMGYELIKIEDAAIYWTSNGMIINSLIWLTISVVICFVILRKRN